MAKSIFVSYNFNDREVVKKVKDMMSAHRNEIDGNVVFVENDVSYNGETAINWEIEHTMEKCDAALFVTGENHHNSPWLDKEVQFAVNKEMPILVTHLPGEQAEKAQQVLPADGVQLAWDSPELCNHMNQC